MSNYDSIIGRMPPHSIEAEEYLLSCCFLDGADVVARCIESELTSAAFYHPANGVIFDACVELFTAGKPVELQVIAESLKERRQLDEIGGYAYLMQISQRMPTTAQSAFFIGRVGELHALRETIKIATGLVESCYAYDGGGVAEAINPSVNRLTSIASGGSSEKEKDWDSVVSEAEADLQAMLDSKGENVKRQIPFPWPRMNELFGPMQRGQLVVLAARASVGKSSLARPILKTATDLKHKAYYVTLEVNPRRVPLQIASSMAGVGLRQVSSAHAADQRDVMQALRSLKGRGITISSKDRSISRIEARARALHAKGMLDILFIDHGGYVQEVYKAQVGEKVGACGLLTKTLKRLADELDIVVVLLWQLNRSSVQQGNREPNLTDLKDSGSLEEDADKVILIHRPDTDPLRCDAKQSESMSTDDLPAYYQNVIQAKGRDDGTALLSFYLHRATATFTPATREDR